MGSIAQTSALIPTYLKTTELSLRIHACKLVSEQNQKGTFRSIPRHEVISSNRRLSARPTSSLNSRWVHPRSELGDAEIRRPEPRAVDDDGLFVGDRLLLAHSRSAHTPLTGSYHGQTERPIEHVTETVRSHTETASVHVHKTSFLNSLGDVSYVCEQSTERSAEPGHDNDDDTGDGPLEILKFLKGKNILITGATGFLGKVLLEKILRVQPDVNQLYLLIQPRAGLTPEQRMESQIMEMELFRVLRSKYGDSYEDFMKSKMTAVGGNVKSPDLGIETELSEIIAPVIDLIVHTAANTSFDERYDVALQDNTLGPTNVMNFAKTCPNLKLFLHVSTAFTNGNRRGNVDEKPFEMGQTIIQELANERAETQASLVSKDLPKLDIDLERKLAEEAAKHYADSNTDDEMRQLGTRRARMFGWQDVYTFSKAMGEMLLFQNRGDIPLAIVRPSVVVSTYKEPFRGWMEGIRVIDPLAVSYGRGLIAGFSSTEDSVVDLIPVDLVVNTILAVMTKHYGRKQRKTFVYQSSSGSLKPLTFRGLSDSFYQHFKTYPMVDKHANEICVERYRIFEDADEFEQYLWQTHKLPALMMNLEEGSKNDKALQREYTLLERSYDSIHHLSRIYMPYTHHWARYECHNTEAVLRQICEEEKETFGYSVSELDWTKVLVESHLPGLRRYVLKGRGIKGLKPHHLD